MTDTPTHPIDKELVAKRFSYSRSTYDREASVQAVSDALARLVQARTGTTLPFSQATHICGRYTKILQHVTRAFAPLCRKAGWMMPLGLNFWLSLCRTRPKRFWVLA